MKIHITGGCGFVGSRLTRQLVDAGHDVTVFDNVSRGAVEKLGEAASEVDLIKGDIREYDELAAAVDEPDVLYHLAAINGTKNFYERPLSVLDVNVCGTQNVVKLMADRDIPRLVFTSSSEAYGFPREFPTAESHPLQVMDAENERFSYAGSKIIGEQYVIQGAAQHDFEYTIARPHNFYGEDMGYDHVMPEFIERLVTDAEFTVYGDGTQTRSFCYIDDGVRALETMGHHDVAANEIYNIGTEHEITINELAEVLFEIADRQPEIRHIESKELSGSPPRRQPDVSKVHQQLGFEPTVSLSEGLERTYEWYRKDFTGES